MTEEAGRFAPMFRGSPQDVGFTITTPRDFTLSIVEETARKHGIRSADIFTHTRRRSVVVARCEAMRRVSTARPHWSYPEIGRFFGGLDHTSVMHHLDKSGRGKNSCRCAERYAPVIVKELVEQQSTA